MPGACQEQDREAPAMSDGELPLFVPLTANPLQTSMDDALNHVSWHNKGQTQIHTNTKHTARYEHAHTHSVPLHLICACLLSHAHMIGCFWMAHFHMHHKSQLKHMFNPSLCC